MVTVTTAENDGQSGRAVCVCADVNVCDCKKHSLSYVYCEVYVPEGGYFVQLFDAQ